ATYREVENGCCAIQLQDEPDGPARHGPCRTDARAAPLGPRVIQALDDSRSTCNDARVLSHWALYVHTRIWMVRGRPHFFPGSAGGSAHRPAPSHGRGGGEDA